ncbi:MAG: preprotein translocase subunit Sec61beta [Methanobacteriota archaeon]|nr:MAG: preprotein translocase subunit Sec61beta [Euryarchaeota archaeon]
MVKRRRDKVTLPSSGAGLIRYMDEEGRGIKLKPEQVVMAVAGIILLKIAFTAF